MWRPASQQSSTRFLGIGSISEPRAGILLEAGIPLIDNVGDHVFTRVHEGDRLILDGGKVMDPAGNVVAEGTLYTTEILDEHLEYARRACRTRSRPSPTTR